VTIGNEKKAHYGIDRFKVVNPDAEAAMIASGTTSYVIRYDVSENFVLKLVKPQFMSSPHIREQTSSYGELLRAQAGHNSFLPRVQATGSSYIQMEFIDGHSLADLLELGILDAMTTDERRELLFGIIGNLEALRTPHLDLSPGNIMVEILPMGRDKIRRFKVRLIDFGYNYLLREGLSGLPIRNDVVRYSAPEMMAGSYEGSIKADLYSLGMIILDVMRSSPNAVDLSVQLDRCWQAHPQLASIVEELIATHPVDRAPWANGLDQPAAYQALRQRLEQEERTTKLIEVRLSAASAWSGFEDLIQEFFKIIREVPALWWNTDNDIYCSAHAIGASEKFPEQNRGNMAKGGQSDKDKADMRPPFPSYSTFTM
jgi:serine/threonine protein kinase